MRVVSDRTKHGALHRHVLEHVVARLTDVSGRESSLGLLQHDVLLVDAGQYDSPVEGVAERPDKHVGRRKHRKRRSAVAVLPYYMYVPLKLCATEVLHEGIVFELLAGECQVVVDATIREGARARRLP